MDTRPFSIWWKYFHEKTNQRKVDKQRCEWYWNKCNFQAIKNAILMDVLREDFKSKLTAIEYLKQNL
jgi:hypothetical protein